MDHSLVQTNGLHFHYSQQCQSRDALSARDDAWRHMDMDRHLVLVTFLVGGGDIDYAIAFVDDLKECLPIACR